MTYTEPKGLHDVQQFHALFNLFSALSPAIPSEKICALRVNLLQEELDELKQAIADGDMTEIADALTDLQYVLSGAVLAFGLQDCFAELFNEVHASNMSKACKTREEAEKTIAYYQHERDTEGYIVEKDDLFLVRRKGDDKALKSVDYHPAQLKPIIDNYTK